MQLLLVSDLHYTLPHFDWVLDHAAEFDVVVLAGDLLDISSLVSLDSQIVVMRTYLRKIAAITPVVVCSGNHDLTARNAHGEKAAPWLEAVDDAGVFGDWDTLDRAGVRFSVFPWWDGPLTREDVGATVAADRIDRPARWIWAYHFPPDDVPVSWIGSRHIGDSDLNGWIAEQQPDLVLCGHIHDAPFRDDGSWISRIGASWVLNAGRSTGPVPAHAIVDLAGGRASWWSAYGQDEQILWPEPLDASPTA
jgi:Icc-related predicted phosphoesterase